MRKSHLFKRYWLPFVGFLVGFLIGFAVMLAAYERVKNETIINPPPVPSAYVEPEPNISEDDGRVYYGKASYYSEEYCRQFNPGCLTASGAPFDDSAFTTACGSGFALGTVFKVSYKENSVEVVCNDRGGFEEGHGRILDLSEAAFAQLAAVSAGVISVEVEVINREGK